MRRNSSIISLLLFFVAIAAKAQINIGGNIYGGGNAGDVDGSTTVSIFGGDLHSVFGGARQANVGGSAFVHVDGANASSYIIVDKLYGGNDIAGTIGTSTTIPAELTEVGTDSLKNAVDSTWNAFVRISTKMNGQEEAADAQKVYIGQLFGGGNGDYFYYDNGNTHEIYHSRKDYTDGRDPIATGDTAFVRPEVGKTYLEILGGSIVYAYGGGNNATITDRTVIYLNNPSKVVNSITDADNPNADNTGELLTNSRFEDKMGINTTFSYPDSEAFQIGRLFGGNNKADMAIRPRWNLRKGKVRNLYGGGNEGRMTSPEGLLMQVDGEGMVVDNVYGGCRKADVRPLYSNGDPVPYHLIQLDSIDNPNNIPAGYASRVRVLKGHVTNVYGGNDISGNVYGGNTVGILTHIYGDVYGGGNGSYAYTDNIKLKDDPRWRDFYYDPDSVLYSAGITPTSERLKSAEALNIFRPNAEKVSILVRGEANNPTIVDGGLYVGGNSASLRQNSSTSSAEGQTHIKIGSYVIVDNVFLGNNGENMIKYNAADDAGRNEGVLRTLRRTDITSDGSRFNSMDLKNDTLVFGKYMEGCAMKVKSTVTFESTENGDAKDYIPYSTQFGSFYCGGNVGSMITNGKTTINFDDKIIVYDKVVGGCNNAFVVPSDYNTIYEGGLTGNPDSAPAGSPAGTIGDKLELNFSGLKIQPKRWNDTHTELIWNTISASSGANVAPVTSGPSGESTAADLDRRLKGGNIYGGCYNSGIVNGNVIINVNRSIIERDLVFDRVEDDEHGEGKLYDNDSYNILERRTGVILDEQGMDVLGAALNIFGGGKGKNTEIWGSTTINMNRGYVFQIFGGSEEGGIGRGTYNNSLEKIEYTYDPRYSTYINLNGEIPGKSKGQDMSEDMAEVEFIYGGGFLGPIAGNTTINLNNGRVFNTFAGSCNADILGHTETYVGVNGFPYVRDYIYGGNDLGGDIKGNSDFKTKVRNDGTFDVLGKVYDEETMKASTYIEYRQGRVEKIFGGCYGVYDYTDPHYRDYFDETGQPKTGYSKPHLGNAFINFRPTSNNSSNLAHMIYGAGQGYFTEPDENKMQQSSYILVDVPQNFTSFKETEIFGAGECGGVRDSVVIDLCRGQVGNVYGGSFQEGITRKTVVNVPVGSTINLQNIFGGAYGLIEKDNEGNDVVRNDVACDVFDANVNYRSDDAIVTGALYGGNNNCRRTLYGKVNVYTPVWSNKQLGYQATVYGAGYGENTWSQYTEVNLHDGAVVYEAYGGGQNGRVLNTESVAKWKETYSALRTTLEDGYTDNGLENDLAKSNRLHEVYPSYPEKYNTNVHIYEGATVGGYCYGGGLGNDSIPNSGDVCGTTYIDLLGGTVVKDLYAAGTTGSVKDHYGALNFTASANAFIEGGKARNVYGGGWKGSVGRHSGGISSTTVGDIAGETHVVIGKTDGTSFIDGIPAIERNGYGGGEGGAVFGTANITLNKGFIGYRHFDSAPTDGIAYIKVGSDYYQEKIHDETWTDGVGLNRLYDSGCIFGGGYIDNSSVDNSNVQMYGGHVRNALFGGGEIAAIGRGVIIAGGENNSVRTLKGIYKAGSAVVTLYDGYVHRNVFGGGRGYNNLGEGGTLYSDGYVFGKTNVNIYGGEIGTDEGLSLGFGNVFGGGDIGYVYSAYEENGELFVGIKDGEDFDNQYEGYYYAYDLDGESYIPEEFVYDEDDPRWVKEHDEFVLTEDCKVLVEPHCRVKSAVTINGHSYAAGDYVPTSDLNTMTNKNSDSRWTSLHDDGIIIHNAVFAGGNTSSGSATVYANATTVFGNATASIHDVFHRDLITLGTGHTGGLYGDGNLTFVDGYRGLNITNYGTDYYNIDKEITLDDYKALPAREAAYYELRYLCKQQCTDNEGKTYMPGSTISEDELMSLFVGVSGIIVDGKPNPAYWEENGVCSRYAGRLMNTIQRADFCGVFGSRMVMQGAQDRVPEVVDYTNYTINRVREVSLNKKYFTPNDESSVHGNYFGIYNVVNYLGGLTSDVHFTDTRETESTNEEYKKDGKTYYEWKSTFHNERKRNNGTSWNKVALASGVYLELTTEKSTGTGLNERDWGYITGIIELDLINVKPGFGGGFVYAKNVHGTPTYHDLTHITLTDLNDGAITRKNFTYSTSELHEWETSGNFVHSTQTIIDDCYNISGKYSGEGAVPAHYWFIKGQVYVYDQIISAYTGAPNAYSEQVQMPLTITATSHGTMKLLDIQPNLYAYYAVNNGEAQVKLTGDRKIVINDVEYGKNTPISYWDWKQLSSSEQSLFVKNTYKTIANCTIGNDTIPADSVLLPNEYQALRTAAPKKTIDGVSGVPAVYHLEKQQWVAFDFVFRESNNLSHDTGYLLTSRVDNPVEWSSTSGPTYHLLGTTGMLLGQREYEESNLISKETYDTYQTAKANHPEAVPGNQATFVPAYIMTELATIDVLGVETHLYPGTAVSEAMAASLPGKTAPAYIATSTIQLSSTEYIYINSRMSAQERTAYINRFQSDNPDLAALIAECVVPAYYCTVDGMYGGNYYEPNQPYRALAAWSSMSKEDRTHFAFNYDALDVLIDPRYSRAATSETIIHPEGQKYQYDSAEGTLAAAEASVGKYSLQQPVDYSATYNGTSTLTYDSGSVAPGEEIGRVQFEEIPNEQRHYVGITMPEEGSVYVVNNPFQVGNTSYAVGSTMSDSNYQELSDDNKGYVTTLEFSDAGTVYYCRESYEVGERGDGHTASPATGVVAKNKAGTDITNKNTYNNNDNVPVGMMISAANYESLVNKQTNFSIHGIAPTETSCLYVSRNSDIFDLSTDKIITVIYSYDYEEGDASGNITPVSERHVFNIRLKFKSGIPSVEGIKTPQIVLPGTRLGLREPNVTPGAYEVTGGGWEIFESESDAESHVNGTEYVPNSDRLYWYQNGYYVAYYAKTYLGKTYSNHEPLSVANYHNLTDVITDKENHYYIDKADFNRLKRDPKVYVTDASEGLTQLKQLFDLSQLTETSPEVTDGVVTTGPLQDHHLLDSKLEGLQGLDFFLHTNVAHTGDWTPIANATGECFSGTLHGEGYYISGINRSLFGHLCGNVYNLGVMGSFTTAGIADTGSGFIGNSWIKSSQTTGFTGNPVFGNPSRGGSDERGPIQLDNCYYPETNPYSITSTNHGVAIQMSDTAFYNGTVAYNLNGYYLNKRFFDNKPSAAGSSPYKYKYLIDGVDGESNPTLTVHEGKYSPDYSAYVYVEDRYKFPDFIYSDGTIPETNDIRLQTDPQDATKTFYAAIWPDDYIFFGQMLTYGWNDALPHQDVPSHIKKSGGTYRLNNTDASNRIYRAPAYYSNAKMDIAHFNPNANLAAYSKPKTAVDTDLKPAYPDMTAIDFNGYNDLAYASGFVAIPGTTNNVFFPPLLDDAGLLNIVNRDETKNLLVYVPSQAANQQTYDVLNIHFVDPVFEEHFSGGPYNTVAVALSGGISGHLVQSGLNATTDHLLVDRENFNCPISYSFSDGHRMWYQRNSQGEEFVNTLRGWQGISLPFEVQLTSTQNKGELTHFYTGSTTGHEYWLRRFGGTVTPKTGEDGVYEADFQLLSGGGHTKEYTNTYLWDTYYSRDEYQDLNTDSYQKNYYKESHTYNGYPYAQAGTPYILGLPGPTYYEFDLSGQWTPSNRYQNVTIASPGKQVVTFASEENATIGVSDTEIGTDPTSGFAFRPSYLNRTFTVDDTNKFTLSSTGSSYDKVTAKVTVPAFRPYFVGTPAGSKGYGAKSIVFNNNNGGSFDIEESDPSKGETGALKIKAKKHKIIVSSTLANDCDVRIVTISGITTTTFTIAPGETVETHVKSGVYIVNDKKIAVK